LTALINITPSNIGASVVQTVNARDLHAFLESKRQFADWIKERIQQYSFVENQDFVTFSQNCEKPFGGRPTTEYAISLDMAKELSMVERNAKGKQARQYFIECERQAKETVLDPRNLTRMQLMQIAMDAERERLVLEHKVAEQAPKVQGFDRIADASGLMTVREAAKNLQVPVRKFVNWLLGNGWLYRQSEKGSLLGHAPRIAKGYLVNKTKVFRNRYTGMDSTQTVVRVTPRGLTVLTKYAPAIAHSV